MGVKFFRVCAPYLYKTAEKTRYVHVHTCIGTQVMARCLSQLSI